MPSGHPLPGTRQNGPGGAGFDHRTNEVIGIDMMAFFDDDTPMPAGELPELRATLKITEVLARVHDSDILERLVALAEPKPPRDATEG